jgi:hypothetical protein
VAKIGAEDATRSDKPRRYSPTGSSANSRPPKRSAQPAKDRGYPGPLKPPGASTRPSGRVFAGARVRHFA